MVIQCPNKCSVSYYTTLMRKDIEKHLNSECILRPYQCEHCGFKDTYENITGICRPEMQLFVTHYDECPAYPLTCPNNCGASGIKRKDMANHHGKCPQELVECPFAEAGCKVKVRRWQFDDHLESNQQKHLLFVMGAYKQMKGNLQSTEAKLNRTETKLNRTETKLNRTETKLNRTETKLNRTETKLNQTETKLKETEAKLKVMEVQLQSTSKETSPTFLRKDGDTMAVTMPKVSEYHRSGKVWHSAPFYFREGYKMCLVVSDIKVVLSVCTRVTVGIQLLQGEHDDNLQWPISDYGPPSPLPSQYDPAHHFIFEIYGLKQLQATHGYSFSGMSFVLVNDCLTFNVRYYSGHIHVEVKI